MDHLNSYIKITRKIILILIIIVINKYLYTQVHYFNNIYNPNNTWSIGLSVLENDTSYIICGVNGDSLTWQHAIFFANINLAGNLNYWNSIGKPYYNYWAGKFGSLSKTNDLGSISVRFISGKAIGSFTRAA